MTLRVSEDSLDWALTHVEKFGDTDIFPVPFEYEAIRHGWDEVRAYLASIDLDTCRVRPSRSCLSPKGKYSYRISTQLDPIDSLIFLALVYEIGDQLEAYRLSRDEQAVFSHRFEPDVDGTLYARDAMWLQFFERCTALLGNEEVTHVVLADISDFFQRIYHHRLENTLDAAMSSASHARVIKKLVSQWAGTPSYGIPVGPTASRLLAEVTIADVDQHLRAEGATFCRYSDDFRIFCGSYLEAYERLSSLAEFLYRSHGLTLQPHKTVIMRADSFVATQQRPETEELRSLGIKFSQLLQKLGVDDPYGIIEYNDLDSDAKRLVDSLNLEDLLDEQLQSADPDAGLTRFILRRLAQLRDGKPAIKLILNAEKLYAVVPDLLEYLSELGQISNTANTRLGTEVLKLIQASIVGHLPFHKLWLLSFFANRSNPSHARELLALHASATDSFARRKAILSLGRAGQDFWFRARKDDALNLPPWERRAFLAAASCLGRDEQRYWYQSLRGRVDKLEEAIIGWVADTPFR